MSKLLTNGQINVLGNKYQGAFAKVLCVCSIGCLRSPTLSGWLYQQGFNTRSCGVDTDYAVIPVSDRLVYWSDVIVCLDYEVYKEFKQWVTAGEGEIPRSVDKKIVTLDIPDEYEYREPEIMPLFNQQKVVSKVCKVIHDNKK